MLARNAGGILLARGVGVVLAMGAQVLLARTMGVGNYGVYVYVLSWLGILALVATLGLHTASLRFITSYRAHGSWAALGGMIRFSARTTVLASAAICVLLVTVALLFGQALGDDLVRTLLAGAAALPIMAVLLLCQNVLHALGMVIRGQTLAMIIRPVALAVLVAAMYLMGPRRLTGDHVMWLHVVACGAALVVGIVWLRRSMPTECRTCDAEFRGGQWLKASLPILLTAACFILNTRCDMLMIGAMLGTKEAGVYAAASRLAELLGFACLAINHGAASLIAELHATGRQGDLQRMLRMIARAVLALSVPVAIGLVFLGPFALGLFGAEFHDGYYPLLVLAIGQLVNVLNAGGGFLMTMTGHERHSAKLIAMSSVLNLSLNAVLIPWLGLIGAAAATTASAIAWNVMLLRFSLKHLGINPTVCSRR